VEEKELLSPTFLQKLKLLQILSKKVNWGMQKGEHSSSLRGRSLEFADFRNYVRGDDIRYIDWNIYGRLEKLFLKLFVEDMELTIYLLIDTSTSMALGIPEKLFYSKRIAASLAFIGLSNFDRVAIGALDTTGKLYQPPLRGGNQIFQGFRFLNGLQSSGVTDLGRDLRNFGKKIKRPGLIVVISDFLQEQDFFEGLNFLLYQKNSLFLLQVVDRLEKEPELRGDVKLVDIETEDSREVSISEKLLKLYRLNFSTHCRKIEDFCMKRGIGYIQTTTEIPFEEIVLKYLRMGRLLA
jgi:uncharacterized protein (DUF58 family)